jgi:uncharacterized protein YdhG (YjbR/CyaY superfamily)
MKKGKTGPAKDVDEYLKELPANVKSMLQKVRKAIMAAAPKVEEVISYGIPTYKYKGPLVHFAAFKDHCSFVVITKSVTEIFKEEFKTYKSTGRTIHFFPDNPLSADLIKKIIKVRIKENEEREGIKEMIKATKKISKKSKI